MGCAQAPGYDPQERKRDKASAEAEKKTPKAEEDTEANGAAPKGNPAPHQAHVVPLDGGVPDEAQETAQPESDSVPLHAEKDAEGLISLDGPTLEVQEGGKEERPEGYQERCWRLALADSQGEISPPALGKLQRRPSSENISVEEYLKRHEGLFQKVLDLETPGGWVLQREESGIEAYTKFVDGESLAYFKAVSDVRCEKGLLDLVTKIMRIEDRPQWDAMCLQANTPHNVPPLYRYTYCQIKAPAIIISDRDMVSCGRIRWEQDGGIVVCLESVDLPGYEEGGRFVRARWIAGGYVLRPTADKATFRVTWAGCVDPGGYLPTWVVNWTAVRQAFSLLHLRNFVAR